MEKKYNLNISLCIIAKNEESFLKKHLPVMANLVSEIIYVDTGSTDFSKKIASNFTDKIYVKKWENSFEDVRNYALKKATKEWILVLDADEVISPKDFPKIERMLKASDNNVVGYVFYQRSYLNDPSVENFVVNNTNYVEGAGYLGYLDVPVVRLFRNKDEIYYLGAAHDLVEYSISKEKKINTNIPIHHYGMVRGREKSQEKDKQYLKQLMKDIKKYPDVFKTRFALGRLLYKLGEFDKAESELKEALKLRPGSSEAYQILGMIYLKRNNIKKAMESARKSLDFNEKNSESWNILGVANANLRNYEVAEKCFMNACILNPGNPKFSSNLALCMFNSGKKKESYKIIKETFLNFPEYPPAIFNYIKMLIELGNIKLALENARKLISIDKTYAKEINEILKSLKF